MTPRPRNRTYKARDNTELSGTVPISPAPMLPVEIIFNVLNHLKDDRSSSLSCALVNLNWACIARSISFRKVIIKFSHLNRFTRLATSPHCSFIQHVRKLEFTRTPQTLQWPSNMAKLDMSEGFKDFAPKMAKVIRLLPHVTWLCLSDVVLMSSRIELSRRFHSGFERIETLVLASAHCGDDPCTMQEIFFSFPNLRRLECNDVRLIYSGRDRLSHPWRPTVIFPLEKAFFPELLELSLVEPDYAFLEIINYAIYFKNIRTLELSLGIENSEPFFIPGEHPLTSLFHEIHPQLEKFSLHRPVQRLGTFELLRLEPDNLTFTFSRRSITQSRPWFIRSLLNGIDIQEIRSLIFNIDLVHLPFKYGWPLTEVFQTFGHDSRETGSNGLKDVTFNIRGCGDEGRTVLAIREALDPGGGKGWWERGMLKVLFS